MKFLKIALKSLISCAAVAVALWVLGAYEYLSQLTQIDNIIGAIPVSLALMFVAAVTILCWMPHGKQTRALCICLSVVVVSSAALFPTAQRGNWWIGREAATNGQDGDVTVYAPFTDGNQTATLNEDSTLTLSDDLPVLDGALALYPVYAAVTQMVYDKSAYQGQAMFTNTLKAFAALNQGERDIVFSSAPSASQRQAAKQAGVDLVLTPIGKEAFVFLVGNQNPINDITTQQIRNIYSGKTAMWRTLGWNEGGSIIAYQRPEGSGSQSGLQAVMGQLPIMAPQPLPDASLIGTNSLMDQISVTWQGVQPALGYSYRFFANTMHPNPNAKFLSVNGVAPTVQNVQSGAYPFTVNFYAITNGTPTGNSKRLIDWLLSSQGQRLIEACGYIPL